jgi:hypothetical protein
MALATLQLPLLPCLNKIVNDKDALITNVEATITTNTSHELETTHILIPVDKSFLKSNMEDHSSGTL